MAPTTATPPADPAQAAAHVFDALPLTGTVVGLTNDRRRAELAAPLHELGARVVEAPAVLRGDVHAVVFTSAPGVTALLESAVAADALDSLLEALRDDVLPVCLTPAASRPLVELGVTPQVAERPRADALADLLCTQLPRRLRREVPIDGREPLVLQGFAVAAGDFTTTLPPLPAAVLAELARNPGWVVSRAELLRRVWHGRGGYGGRDGRAGHATGRDEHAVEATVARLRTALGPAGGLVKTVTKRGYRLAVDP